MVKVILEYQIDERLAMVVIGSAVDCMIMVAHLANKSSEKSQLPVPLQAIAILDHIFAWVYCGMPKSLA